MSDYQAIYDAIRSRFHMPDIGDIIRRQFDVSFAVEQVRNSWEEAAHEQMRPSVVYRPKIYPDGDQWCALYGDDLQSGVAGFGDTPSKAMYDFDHNWTAQTLRAGKP